MREQRGNACPLFTVKRKMQVFTACTTLHMFIVQMYKIVTRCPVAHSVALSSPSQLRGTAKIRHVAAKKVTCGFSPRGFIPGGLGPGDSLDLTPAAEID